MAGIRLSGIRLPGHVSAATARELSTGKLEQARHFNTRQFPMQVFGSCLAFFVVGGEQKDSGVGNGVAVTVEGFSAPGFLKASGVAAKEFEASAVVSDVAMFAGLLDVGLYDVTQNSRQSDTTSF